ncbi:MAG: hypothetical protein WB445_04205 [Acinetobacter sp.]
MLAGFKRAKILSYSAKSRTAKVHIHGMTDGASDGLTATFAYPVGDSDKDTEREILAGEDVYVFFENGEESRPVIAFFSSHGENAVVDTRRIRQENIELLARSNIKVQAKVIEVDGSETVNIHGAVQINLRSEAKVSISAPQISINGV